MRGRGEEVLRILQAREAAPGVPLAVETAGVLRAFALELLGLCEGESVPVGGACPYTNGAAPPSPLTRREAEVAWWMGRGLTNCEIAARLGIATRTVDTHRDHILRKLEVNTRSAVAGWMVRAG